MTERTRSLLPPRRRDWKPGVTQVGLFIRSTTGTSIESSVPAANPAVAAAAWWLLHVAACNGCNHCGPARGKALRAYEMLGESLRRDKLAKQRAATAKIVKGIARRVRSITTKITKKSTPTPRTK